MLKKLVKYDLKWINKSMIVFFVITLIVVVLTRITSYMDNIIISKILYFVLRCCSTACVASTVINCAIRIWTRFILNIYKDESYLTHTLPVSKNTLYNSKMISGVISLTMSLFVVSTCLIVVYFDKTTLFRLKTIFSDGETIFIFFSVILTSFLEIIYLAQCGIMGLIIGHKYNNRKIAKSIFFGVALYFIIQLIIMGLIVIIGSFNSDVAGLFSGTANDNLNFSGAVKYLIAIVNIIYILFVAGMYFVGKKLFNKGVNVD